MDKVYDDTQQSRQTAELLQAKKLLKAFKKKKKDKYRRFIEKKIDIDKDKKWKKFRAHCAPFLAESIQLILSKIYKNDELFVPMDIIRVILELYGYFEMCYQSMFYFYHMTYVLDFGFYYALIIKRIEKQHISPNYWGVYSRSGWDNYSRKDYHKKKAIKFFALFEKHIADNYDSNKGNQNKHNLLSFEKDAWFEIIEKFYNYYSVGAPKWSTCENQPQAWIDEQDDTVKRIVQFVKGAPPRRYDNNNNNNNNSNKTNKNRNGKNINKKNGAIVESKTDEVVEVKIDTIDDDDEKLKQQESIMNTAIYMNENKENVGKVNINIDDATVDDKDDDDDDDAGGLTYGTVQECLNLICKINREYMASCRLKMADIESNADFYEFRNRVADRVLLMTRVSKVPRK